MAAGPALRTGFGEIDLLRTVAMILMVVFHLVYDLNEFAGLDVNYWSGFWYWVGRAAAWTFIFLSGISSGFSRNTIKRGHQSVRIRDGDHHGHLFLPRANSIFASGYCIFWVSP